ncbi:MAG TPA: tetratricopeptide repeat protein, partial [Kofleriaceae bacterium]|nr:tetratricopeptide repeat protein [Kofleriaceae bacterium]
SAREPDELAHRTAVGRALLALGRYREAVRVLVAVVEADPDLLWGWITLAETYRQQRRLPEWKHAVVRAGTLNPEHPAVLVQTGDVAAVLDHDPVRAISNYERALTANPRWFPAHIALGVLAWQGRRLEVAEDHLVRAADIAPWSGIALGMLARFRSETGRGEVALEALEQEALELPYGGLAAHLGRACYAVFDDNDRAVRLLEVATGAAPEDAGTHHDLARAYHAVGRFEDAVRSARRAVALSPDLAEAWILLGRSCVVLDRHPEAIEALERGLTRFPDDPLARGSYAIALAGAGDPRRAIDEYEKALAIVPDEGSLLYNLASTLYEIGDIERARPVAERARQHLPPDDPYLAELLRLLDQERPG